jgi:hypothetical protein
MANNMERKEYEATNPFSLLWYNVGTCKLVLGYVSPYGGLLALATQLLTNEVLTYYMNQLTYLDIA